MMHIPERIYGIENEFAIVGQESDGTLRDVHDSKISNLINLKPMPETYIAYEPIQQIHRAWHSNGSCTYIDTGAHPEHASSECRTVRDAVAYNKAGELLASRMFGRRKQDETSFLLFKNNLGYSIDVKNANIFGQFGCHENYLLNTCDFHLWSYDYDKKITLFQPLIPFLATRQIFDGSGWWEQDGTFHLSQRAFSIENEGGRSSTFNRPFFQIKTTDTGKDMRLHIICGDANICEFALYLKLGTTSLILGLLESNCCPIIKYHNAVDALKKISCSCDPSLRLFELQDGSCLSALEIQTIYFEAARTHLKDATFANEDAEQEAHQILVYWEQVLHAIANHDHKWKRGRIDYATKEYLATTYLEKMNNVTRSKASLIRKTIDIMYHGITDATMQRRIKTKWSDRRILTDEEIDYATRYAPQNTRARMRGLFINHVLETSLYLNAGVKCDLGWNYITLWNNMKKISLDLPYGLVTHTNDFNHFFTLIQEMNSQSQMAT